MNKSVEYLSCAFSGNSDFILRDFIVNKRDKLYIVFFESLCDSKSIYSFAIKNVENYIILNKKIKSVENIISSPKLTKPSSNEDLFFLLENGYCLIFFKSEIVAIEVKAEIDRGIDSTQSEPSMFGPRDAFCENYQKNLGVLKRRVKSKELKVDTVDRGIYTKTRVSLLYLDDLVNKSALNSVKERLENLKNLNVTDSYDLAKELSLNKIFPTIIKTEKPGVAAKFILKGHIVVMIDNTPFALVLDAKFKDFVNPTTTDKFVKILRYICFALTILTPAFYIALINFNQETIPSSLLINFMEQRSSVPFPAIIEAILMLLVCEILREADIRFPNNYGSAASILGALVIGEAAVSAGVVSAIMIIVIAITFITNLIFTDIKFVWAIRILRFSSIIIAGFLGLYGLGIAFIAGMSMLANVCMYEGEYL